MVSSFLTVLCWCWWVWIFSVTHIHVVIRLLQCSRSELQRGCVSGCCCPLLGCGQATELRRWYLLHHSAAGLSSSVLQFWFWLWRIQIFKEDLQELYKWHLEVLIDRHLNKLFQYSVEIIMLDLKASWNSKFYLNSHIEYILKIWSWFRAGTTLWTSCRRCELLALNIVHRGFTTASISKVRNSTERGRILIISVIYGFYDKSIPAGVMSNFD